MLCSRFDRFTWSRYPKQPTHEVNLKRTRQDDDRAHGYGEILHVRMIASDQIPIGNNVLPTCGLQCRHVVYSLVNCTERCLNKLYSLDN